jgi:hypothetical protein
MVKDQPDAPKPKDLRIARPMARPRHSGNGFRLLLASGARRRLGQSESVSCVRLPEPADLTSLVPRTDLSGDRGWETARMAIIESDEYPSATFVRDPALATDRSPLAWCAGGEESADLGT